jgi:hypothetical protein
VVANRGRGFLNNSNTFDNAGLPTLDSTKITFQAGDPFSSGASAVVYFFADVTGYQKIGSYIGNGSTGQPIPTGFEPSFLLIRKADDSQNWIMLDNVRDPSNPKTKTLLADTSGAETVTTQNLSFTSTGFTLSNFHVNDNGTTFIYLAIA